MHSESLSYIRYVAYKFILKDKRNVAIFLSSSLMATLTAILLPYLLGFYTDDVILKKNIHLFYYSVTVIVLSIVAGQFSSILSGVYSTRIHGTAYISYNLDILSHVQSLPLAFFNDKDSAYITKRINDDTEEVISFILDNVTNLILDIVIISSIVAILFVKFHHILTIVFLSAVALDIALYLYFKNIIYAISFTKKELHNDYFASLNESVSKIKFIKAHSITGLIHANLNKKFKQLLHVFVKFTKTNHTYISLSKLIRRISIVFVLIICGNGIFSEEITAGDFVLSVTYFMLGFSCLDNFPELAKKWQNVSVSIDRIKTILNLELDHNGNILISTVHSITLKNVCYSGSNDYAILDDFSYTFNQGSVYLVTGNNGAGKSTLLNIIIGLLPTKCGELLYNDIPAKDADTANLRAKLVSYCDQTDDFLNMGIGQNIILDNTNVDSTSLNTLLEQFDLKSKLTNELLSRDDPIDIKLLSGGEKRKISIMRTLLKDSSVYIFDEPTNALDSQGIKSFKQIISSLKTNRIIIIVSHDKSLVEIADHVLDL